jgi:hypothetical protein
MAIVQGTGIRKGHSHFEKFRKKLKSTYNSKNFIYELFASLDQM